jgi:hypothetical protein
MCLIVLVFNVGEYRRDAVKFYADKDFFDPDNTEAVAVRKYVYIFSFKSNRKKRILIYLVYVLNKL